MAPISTVSEGWPELPIRQRGLFLNDNFFRDSREHFQQALDKVLHDWEDQKLSDWHSSKLTHWDQDIFSDSLKRYRTLRKDNLQTDVQAVTEINDEHQYKIIIDVREFMQGCLKTSIVGERELLVEGSIEEITSGVKGKRTFEKRFLLPSEAILCDTTSALSSDGILTIISPKKIAEKEIKENQKEALSKSQNNQNKSTSLNQKHSMFSDDFIDESLPISRKGHFFSDSSFKHAHEDFNRAVRDVLGRWNETSENDIASYRNLRRRSLEEENQAFTEKENHCIYKIVIDVHDFVTDGEVNVKVVNDIYLEVEGCIDKEEEETKCKKTFKRRFTLPKNTDIKNISSLLSSDGVLTITAPKVPGTLDFTETIIPMKLEKFLKKVSSGSASETEVNNSSLKNQNETHSAVADACTTGIESNAESENEMKKNINNEFIIPVTLEGNYDDAEHQNVKIEQQSTSAESRSCQEIKNEILSEASASDKYISSEKQITNTVGLCISDDHNEKTIKGTDGYLHNVAEEGQTLPITRRGSFFTDPFFEDSRLILRKSIRDIIDKSGFVSKDDDFNFYRSMLERSTNKENQAATITESDNIYKIVLDIQGFSAEDIKTKFLSSTELVIEATTEQKEEGSSSTRHFRRCFVFPNSVNVEDVITSLSSDGILTISAPKKIIEDKNDEGSCSKDLLKHINMNNGWEDEQTAQTSSERDGVRSKTFSKSKSSYHHINGVN